MIVNGFSSILISHTHSSLHYSSSHRIHIQLHLMCCSFQSTLKIMAVICWEIWSEYGRESEYGVNMGGKGSMEVNILGFSNGSVDKESACNARDLGLIPRSERPLEKEMATHSRTLA